MRKLPYLICLGASLIAVFLVYANGLSGGFLFDDSINIVENPKVQVDDLGWNELYRAAFSTAAGPLRRPVSMASFAANHAATGLDTYYFKLTNLGIHIAAGASCVLLAWLLLAVSGRGNKLSIPIAWLSLIIGAAWALHPINLTSVLYIVQRMTSLSALFAIWGLIFYLWGRQRQLDGKHGASHIIGGFCLFGLLSALSKENGLLLPLLIVVVEWTLLKFKAPNASSKRFVLGFNVAFGIAPVLIAVGILAVRSDIVLAPYDYRDFTLGERLLTQARVLWFYARLILLPDSTEMALHHDDIQISQDFMQPISTLASVLAIGGIVLTALLARNKAPVLSFGILFFLVGHAMESTVLALEMVHEHRNYLPSFGLVFAASYYFGHLRVGQMLGAKLQYFVYSAMLAVLALSTTVRASYWSDNLELTLMAVHHHPNSARANLDAGRVHYSLASAGIGEPDNYDRAKAFFRAVNRLDRHNLNGAFSLLYMDQQEGKPSDPKFLDQLYHGLATLPLAPASVNALIQLNRCQTEERCTLPTEVMSGLFEAVTKNPSLVGNGRAQIYTELAQFAINHDDFGVALYVTTEAIKHNDSDPQTHLNYAKILLELGEFAEAKTALDRAKSRNDDGYLEDSIGAFERILQEATEGTREGLEKE